MLATALARAPEVRTAARSGGDGGSIGEHGGSGGENVRISAGAERGISGCGRITSDWNERFPAPDSVIVAVPLAHAPGSIIVQFDATVPSPKHSQRLLVQTSPCHSRPLLVRAVSALPTTARQGFAEIVAVADLILLSVRTCTRSSPHAGSRIVVVDNVRHADRRVAQAQDGALTVSILKILDGRSLLTEALRWGLTKELIDRPACCISLSFIVAQHHVRLPRVVRPIP
eukprot:7382653-Prymnesium_polylepis.2